MTNFALSNSSKRRREGIDPRLIEIDDLAIQITTVDFGHPAHSGLRTADEQKALFDNKKSKCDGYDKLSAHQKGKALDFYAYVDGRASWNKLHLSMVAAAYLQAASMLGYKLQWGGLWENFKDYPHVQLID